MTTFQLPGMTCGHCASSVTRALQQVDPACQVSINLPTRTVQVQSQQSHAVLAAALAEAGYQPA